MSSDSKGKDRIVGLFNQQPGTPITLQDVAAYREFAASAPDQHLVDMIETVRRWRTAADGQSQRSVSDSDIMRDVQRPGISAVGEGSQDIANATSIPLPMTAAEIIELVRRAPEIFDKFSPAERLEAIRLTTSKRFRERLELVEAGTSSSVEEEQAPAPTAELPQAATETLAEDRVQNWLQRPSDEASIQSTSTQSAEEQSDGSNTTEKQRIR